jgi:hypothetical protein
MSLVRLGGSSNAASAVAVQHYVRSCQPDGAEGSTFEHAWQKFNAAGEATVEEASRRLSMRFPFAPRKPVEFPTPFSRVESWGLALTDLHDIRGMTMDLIEPAGAPCASPAALLALHFYMADSQSCLHCAAPVNPPLGSGLLLSALAERVVLCGADRSWTSCPEAVASIVDMILRDVLGEPKAMKGDEALWCHASLRAKAVKRATKVGAKVF